VKDILGVYMCDSSHVNATCALTSSGGVCQVIARQQLLVTCSSSLVTIRELAGDKHRWGV